MVLLAALLPCLLGLFAAVSAIPPRPHVRGPANLWRRPSIPRLRPPPQELPVTSRNGTVLPSYSRIYWFDQLIDHNNPSLGTFRQRYWHTYEFYEPGGPIILSTPGETNAETYTSYLANSTINGRIAQELNGATIVLEHRFFGESNPYDDLSEANLRVLTVQQAVNDLVYFAQNVKLPMPNGDKLAPGKAPWILIGGSYAGALTSYTLTSKPNVFYAGFASSAVVEAITDFWGYFDPILEFMPANCSADVQAAVAHIDTILQSNDQAQISSLKTSFGLQNLAHNDDFAVGLQQNLLGWQDLQPDNGPDSIFYQFCDALEVKNGVSAPASGWGVDHAIQAWGAFWKSSFYQYLCGDDENETCLGTYDTSSPYWTYTYTDQPNRSWNWLVCNEFGFYLDGAPASHPSLSSRLITPSWGERQCGYRFPNTFNRTAGAVGFPRAAALNNVYGGWNTTAQRLIFGSGSRDPWRQATVASTTNILKGTDMQPHLLSDGFHCSDLLIQEGDASASVKSVQDQAVSYFAKWIGEWKPTA